MPKLSWGLEASVVSNAEAKTESPLAMLKGLKTPGRAMPKGLEAPSMGSAKAKSEYGKVLGGQCQSQVESWRHLDA